MRGRLSRKPTESRRIEKVLRERLNKKPICINRIRSNVRKKQQLKLKMKLREKNKRLRMRNFI